MSDHQTPDAPETPTEPEFPEWAAPHRFFLALIIVVLTVAWLPRFLMKTFHISP